MINIQQYPRLKNDLLDERKLVSHSYRIPKRKLKNIIIQSIQTADRKSSRAILNLPENASQEKVQQTYSREGKALFIDYVKMLLNKEAIEQVRLLESKSNKYNSDYPLHPSP